MFQLSFMSILVLTISASFVFTTEVFHADTTNLQNEPLVSVMKKNDNRTQESSRMHEELHRNITRNNSTVMNGQPKADSSKEAAKNLSATSTIQNATMSSTQQVSQNVTKPIKETTPVTKEESVTPKVGNFAGEQANLNQCCVTPLDEEDEDTVTTTIEKPKEKVPSIGSTLGTTPSSTMVTLSSTTATDDIDPSKVTKDVKSIKTASGDTITTLNATMYETVSPESANVTGTTAAKTSNATATATTATTTAPTSTTTTTLTTPTITKTPINTTITTTKTPINTTTTTTTPTITKAPINTTITTTKTPINTTTTTTTTTTTIATTVTTNATTTSNNNQTEGRNNTTTLEGLEHIQQAELSEKDKESSNGSKGGSMPAGIIALVTAITFAVAIVIGYISMLVWKQYLEHRYGRRELLVNELEFDTNDLRHFEL